MDRKVRETLPDNELLAELRSLSVEIERFVESPIWKRIMLDVEDRIGSVDRDMNDPSRTSNIEEVRMLQGEKKSLEYMAGLLDAVHAVAQSDIVELTEKDNEDE